MCRALILGAGGVGTVVTQKIAANPVFSDVMLASRTKSKCDAVAAAIGGNRVKTAQVDADNVPDTGFFNNVRLNRVLCHCVVDVVLDKVYFNFFLSTATRKDQKG